MLVITNAFSLNMLAESCQLRFKAVSLYTAKQLVQAAGVYESAVGHADIAQIIADQLGVAMPYNRKDVKVWYDSTILVAQYTGQRLPEGCKQLPEGANITYWLVEPVSFN